MPYRVIELYSSIRAHDASIRAPIAQQVASALEGVPRESIVSISYAPYPHEPDSFLALIVLEQDS